MLINDGGNGTKTRFRIAALFLVAAGLGVGCGSVSQTGDAGSAGASGGSAGATAGPSGGGAGNTSSSAGASGSAGAHGGTDGGAGSNGSAGAHGGPDGGAGSSAADRDGGGACVCSAIYSPVCGVDGKTYASSCNAACAGVAVAHAGACVAATDGGADGSVPLGYCDQAADCIERPAGPCTCSQTCAAKTDPVPQTPPYACAFACPLIVLDCGCVNHQCTAGASTAATP